MEKLARTDGQNVVPGLKDLFHKLLVQKNTEIESLKFGPSLSAVLAITSLTSESIKISDFPQNSLPFSVIVNPKSDLGPFLKAAAKDGYQTTLQRKCFIIGNSGIKIRDGARA